MTTTNTNSEHPVTRRLQMAGIRSAVVIDDAYNTPDFDDLTAKIADFWAAIVREESALTELKALKEGFEGEDDIDEELINALWTRTLNEEQSSLLFPCKNTLFSLQLENLADLAPLVGYLKRIGVTPILLGTKADLPEEQLKLFFLDFFLDPATASPSPGEIEAAIREFLDGTPENPSIQASITMAKEILRKNDDAFIILMSSKENVEVARDRFRQETDLIEGIFDYVPKEKLADERELNLILGISAASWTERQDIQRFVNAFETSLTEASSQFIDLIKSLSFEDYMYIYSHSLHEDGHPLGDYMSWLYKSLLGHLVHDQVQVIETQKRLDDINMEAYVPLKRAPSKHLVEMYSLSLTEPGPSSNLTQLRLGDLYVNRTKDVLLVINADCDLARLPPSPDSQSPDVLSILLHPGRLEPVEKKFGHEHKVTKFFFLEEEPYQIVWYYEGVFTKKYCELHKWLCDEGYSKKARLITPHALEIQQHFAAKLTRVGMPVAPPFSRPATVQVFGKNEDGTLKKLGADIPRGVVIDRKKFRFYKEGFIQLLERVAEGISHYTAIHDSCEVSKDRRDKVGKNIRRLDAWLQDFAELFNLIESSHKLPSEEGQQIGSNGVLEVFCRPNLKSAELIIALNLLPDD